MPLTIETPMTTANAVSSARTLRPARPLRATAIIGAVTSSSVARISCARGRPEVADDVAVGEEQHAVGDRRGVRVVRDHHGRLAERVDRVAQQREDLAAGAWSRGCRSARRRTSPSGARRARGRRPRAAAGRRRAPTGGARGGRRGRRSSTSSSSHAWSGFDAGELQRQHDVLGRRQHRQQVEELEDEADVVAAQLRQRRVVETADRPRRRRSPHRRSAGRGRPGCASASTCRSPTGPSRRSGGHGRCRPTRRAAHARRSRRSRNGGSGHGPRRRPRAGAIGAWISSAVMGSLSFGGLGRKGGMGYSYATASSTFSREARGPQDGRGDAGQGGGDGEAGQRRPRDRERGVLRRRDGGDHREHETEADAEVTPIAP